jgi:hypothetical protein
MKGPLNREPILNEWPICTMKTVIHYLFYNITPIDENKSMLSILLNKFKTIYLNCMQYNVSIQ